jgi:hypothetical protein
MINIDGSVKLSFLFPAPRPLAFAFYGDLRRVAEFMPHLEVVGKGSAGQFRMLFEIVEMGTYTIRILYDVRMERDPSKFTLCVRPATGMHQKPPTSGVNDTTAHGDFFTDATFTPEGEKTRIVFQMRLEAELLPPKSMRFVPGRVANKMANNFTDKRLQEIAVGFVNNSLAGFPAWRAQNERGDSRALPGGGRLSTGPLTG